MHCLIFSCILFFRKYTDLYKWFKDFLGYKENNNNNVELVPKKIETQERERVVGDFATEIGMHFEI